MGLITIKLGWFVMRQKKNKKKRERSSRPQRSIKTSVWVSVYMVEEKGIEIENKNTKKKKIRLR